MCHVQNKTNIGMKKHGICIPEEFGNDIVAFEQHLKDIREGKIKSADNSPTAIHHASKTIR